MKMKCCQFGTLKRIELCYIIKKNKNLRNSVDLVEIDLKKILIFSCSFVRLSSGQVKALIKSSSCYSKSSASSSYGYLGK
jgi:hypothetical protein